jgi:hypothetical protein
MKGFWFYILFQTIFFQFVRAQNDEDALRYSRGEINGTARFRAMGGAMGALGADMSCMNNNPAGIGVYRKSDLSVTFGLNYVGAKSIYNDSTVRDSRGGFALPNFGIAGAGVDRPTADKKHYYRTNLALSLNRLSSFRNNITIGGNSKGSTMGLAFSAAAQGKKPEKLDDYYEFYPFYYDLIDTINNDSTLYQSAIPQGANNRQEMGIIESGGVSEFALTGGYTYDDRIYWGYTIGVPYVKFTRNSLYTESCLEKQYATPNTPYKISSFTYEEFLTTKGIGINLKLGLIYRFSEKFRAGIAYHSPTAFSLKDTYNTGFGITYKGSLSFYDSTKTGRFSYSLFSPEKIQLSASVLLQKAMAINFDFETMNYGTMRLKSRPDYFVTVDKYIRQHYKRAFNFKMGFEYNVKPVIVRAGFSSYGSPEGKFLIGKGVRNFFSAGAGYKWKNNFVDFSYSFGRRSDNYYMYNSLYVTPAVQKFSQNFILFTFGTKV